MHEYNIANLLFYYVINIHMNLLINNIDWDTSSFCNIHDKHYLSNIAAPTISEVVTAIIIITIIHCC